MAIGYLVLEGQRERIKGKLMGRATTVAGEIVFQTGQTGYVEALTDPSYARQILVLTYPLIGNYGVPKMMTAGDADGQQQCILHNNNGMESPRIWPSALVVGKLSEIGSHWNSNSTLCEWLDQQGVPILIGVDTRKLTKMIRTQGAMRAKLIFEADNPDIDFVTISARNLVAEVSRKTPIWLGIGSTNSSSGPQKPRILVLDIGLKANQARCLLARNCALHIVPWDFPFNLDDYDGLFVSNGPGDPGHVCLEPLIQRLAAALTSANPKPIFAICLGHQVVARAAGAFTKKMKFGNRGHNLPAIHVDTGRCFITAQNHGYAVEDEQLPSGWHRLFWNANDRSNEGLIHESRPFFTVQFHPEHAGGPTDLGCLFDIFVSAVKRAKANEPINLRAEIKQKFTFNSDYRMSIGQQRKVLILGSGGLSIGQAGEFDYSGAQAIKALKEMGIKTVLVNANVATFQTTKGFADRVYFLPITVETVSEIIEKERPTGILCTFGGQTALNCALALHKKGIFDKFGCRVLGTPMDAILCTEDRDMFRMELEKIGERVAPSKAATTLEEAEQAAREIGYPVLVRAAFALGGLGSGFAQNKEELKEIATQALAHSEQILIDKSVRGWKEIEYEVVRDAFDNCITVCNMENIDPVGIHTGESVVVAPSQTLNNEEYFGLRKTALRVIRHFGIVGECNIQYALNPEKFEYYIIEVNARLSRSSALASKATGYPLAFVAAKLALGASLPELRNMVTGGLSTACFEPALDYCVVKVPRWDLNKFSGVNTKIGSSMKSVGEAMAIGRTFEEALQKALRMANDSYEGFSPDIFNRPVTKEDLEQPTDKRMFAIARFLRYGDERGKENSGRSSSSNEEEGGEEDEWAHILAEEAAEEKLRAENGGNDYGENHINRLAERVHKVTGIDRWFLARMCSIVGMYNRIEKAQHALDLTVANKIQNDQDLPSCVELIKEAKEIGFSDGQIARLIGRAERTVREWRRLHGIVPFVKQIDTVAGEWPATTNYLYLTYNAQEHDVEFNEQQDKAVMVLGSGVYRIGSSVEFDACAVGCVQTLDKLGHKTIMINCNPETVSTDYDICNRLYFEEISLEVVSTIYELEMPLGAILAFGGQAANNIALSLDSPSLMTVPIKVFGTSPKCIDEAEDRFKFSRILDDLDISQPKWRNAASEEEAVEFCAQVGYPCLIRPSYVLSGAAMAVAHNEADLREYLKKAKFIARDKPVVVSQFIEDAKEIDVDVICIGGRVLEKAISEHIENAGIHSGDATLVTPPQDLTAATIAKIGEIARKIGNAFKVTGPFNLQLIAKNDNLFVIECNLRVSRSFPFISKTLEYDFVGLATKAMLYRGSPEQFAQKHVPQSMPNKIGVKVAQFSFSRLAGAEVLMGVEMRSTGEVACFGKTTKEAYVKALLSTGFKLPSKTIFISFGGEAQKKELEKSVQILLELGYPLLASAGTANYYNEKFKDANISLVEWDCLDEARKQIELMIILPRKGSGTYQQQASTCTTNGYRSRRLAVDSGISLITDLKCAKLFISAMLELRNKYADNDGGSQRSLLPPIDSGIDALSSAQLIRLPGGIVDCHVHMREPGGEHKETWLSGTKAAIAGGVTLVLAMPNTNPALIDQDSYDLVDKLASKSALCDYALFVGATAENSEEAKKIAPKCAGLKMYLNDTYSALRLPSMSDWKKHLSAFPSDRPIVCHAEGQTLGTFLLMAKFYDRQVHICHVSSAEEIELIHEAKKMGHKITCEVCPHHLLMNRGQLPEGIREVRPRLNESKDCAALWAHLDCCIDCFASDHAPHTLNEKNGKSPPPGFPGVELMLPLLLTAMSQGKCTLDQLVDKLIYAPRHIFGLPKPEPNTYVEVDLSEKWKVPENGGQSKAGWSPYAGQVLTGRVRTVVMRGQTIYVDGKFVETNNGKNVLMELAENGLEQMPPIAPSILLPGFLQQQQQLHQMPSPSFTAGPFIAGQQGSRPNKWFGKHVLRVEQFDRGMLHQLFAVANQFEKDELKTYFGQLKKMTGALAFFEPSTRTKCSFMNAINELDGRICDVPSPEHSSTKKGESLEDTIKTLCQFKNKFIVLRHPEIGAADRAVEAARGTNVCIINAGDGVGQHPTQALLDVYTIRKKLSTVNNKRIAIVGDLLNGRTAHSLAKILCLYKNITLHYIAPTMDLMMPADVIEYVAKNSNFEQKMFTNLEEGLNTGGGVDVIYMTRIQQERFKSQQDQPKNFVLTSNILENLEVILMHPLPRNQELDIALDNDKRNVIFDQMGNGLYIRMALLKLMLIEQ